MQQGVAAARSGGETETPKEGLNESVVVKTLVQILASGAPKTAFLDALERGVIPDDICLELAECFDELVKVTDFDNRFEIVAALHESGAISNKTQEILLLTLFELDEQESVSAEAETPIQVTTPESPVPISSVTDGATGQAPVPQVPPANRLADLVRSAAELQSQSGTADAVPEERLTEIRKVVSELTEEEFNSLRQQLGSAILAQAEFPVDQRQVNIPASLEVIAILFDPRQAELTRSCFNAYEVLFNHEGFRLTHRNGNDRPLMTVNSIHLLRNRFRSWLDSHESGLGEDELVAAQKTATTLDGFLLAAADDRIKAAIQRDHARRLRERIISSWVRVLDAVSEELIAALPRTKEEAVQRAQVNLEMALASLGGKLRTVGSCHLCEAEVALRQILGLYSAARAQRREIAELEADGYDPAVQRPALSDSEKRLNFFELERKELDSIRAELEAVLKESDKDSGRNRKKLNILMTVTVGKLEELDQLIAGLWPATEVSHG